MTTSDNNTQRVSTMRSRNIHDRIKQDEEELAELLKLAQSQNEQVPPVKEEEEAPKEPEAPKEVPSEPTGWEKRYKDAQRYITTLQNEIKALKETKPVEDSFVPKTKEEVTEWMKKFPEAASFIQTIAVEKAKSSSADIRKDMEKLEQMRLESVIAKTEAAIVKKHADYFEIKADDKFHKWAESLPSQMQQILYETVDDPSGVARIITLYKTESGDYDNNDNERAAAESVRTGSRKTEIPATPKKAKFSESGINRMPMKEYERLLPEIEEAIREGNFLYDLTRKQ